MNQPEYGGNLSGTERTVSAVLGVALSLFVFRGGGVLLRSAAALGGAGLLARAFAGHCAVKAALTRESSLGEGVRDQWRRMSGGPRAERFAAQESVEERADPMSVEEGPSRVEPSMPSSAG
jgi:hypothetical protein